MERETEIERNKEGRKSRKRYSLSACVHAIYYNDRQGRKLI